MLDSQFTLLLGITSRTSLEAEAYAAFMAGNLAFHREEHKAALDKFATAKRIYSDLSQVGTPSQRELFSTFADELQPFVRFCEHRLALQGQLKGRSEDADVSLDLSSSGDSASNALLQSKIDMVLLEARKQKVANLGSVEWKHKQVAIPSQELGLALLGPDEVAAKLEKLPSAAATDDKKREQLFLELLSSYDSVLQVIKNEMGKLQQQSKSGSALVHTDIEVLQTLEEYVRFQKLSKQVERTVNVYKKLRFTAATQLGELTHILDMLVQSVGDILAIPGLSEYEKLRAAKYSAYQATFRAIRAVTIARSYLQQHKFAEAMALYQYAAGFLAEADEILSAQPAAKDVILQEFGKDLNEELAGAVSRTTAQSFLEQSSKADAVRSQLAELKVSGEAKTKSLLERQDDYVAGTAKGLYEVVKLPPSFQAVPCKPLLFDVAFNELEMPDITERTKTEEEKQAEAEAAKQASSSGGLFGWFRK